MRHLVEFGVRWPPETFVAQKLAGLAGAGLRVTVASRERSPGDGPEGVELLPLPAVRDRAPATVIRLARGLCRLAARDPRRLRRLVAGIWARGPRRKIFGSLAVTVPVVLARPDLLHFEWESAAVRSLPLMEACDCPVTVSVRGSGVNVHPFTGQEGLAASYPDVFARAAAVHCVSEAAREAAEGFGLHRGKARVIHPAVDTGFFTPGPEGDGRDAELRVVSVGELNWLKGYGDALEAVALLARDGVTATLEVVGGEPGAGSTTASDRTRSLFLVSELGLEERVRWSGHVSHEDVRERLRGADVLLHASWSEGLPNSVLEAMACGLPVVVTDCGGTREAVEHGVQGLVCPPRSPRALADALASLHADRALARRMGEAGRARVEADFALPDQIAAWERLYEEVARVSPAPRR